MVFKGGVFTVGSGHLDGLDTPALIFNFLSPTSSTLVVADNSTLDREKLGYYEFNVTAKHATCNTSNVATVLITLMDVNDKTPKIIAPPV